jgi:hypothetical protein
VPIVSIDTAGRGGLVGDSRASRTAWPPSSSGTLVTSPEYRKTISLLDAIYASDRLSREGVLIIGYHAAA